MMGMIGFTVGFIGFLLHNVIDAIEEPILEKALGNDIIIFTASFQTSIELAKEGKIGIVWCWRVGMGVILATLSSIIIGNDFTLFRLFFNQANFKSISVLLQAAQEFLSSSLF